MVNEAGRVLEEEVVTDPADVDFGMIMGTGWAPFRGGPLKFAESVGISAVVSRLDHLAGKFGEHFKPCALLSDMVNRGGTFVLQPNGCWHAHPQEAGDGDRHDYALLYHTR